jgi:hypothetical protein
MDVPPPPIESAESSLSIPVIDSLPGLVPPDVPFEPVPGIPLEYQRCIPDKRRYLPRSGSIADRADIKPRPAIGIGNTHDSPICHSKEDNLIQRHVRRVSIVINSPRPTSYRSTGVDTESTMIVIDGSVPNDQSFAGDGRKDDASGVSVLTAGRVFYLRRTNVGVDSIVSQV